MYILIYIYIFIYLFIDLFVYLFNYLFIYLFIYLSIYIYMCVVLEEGGPGAVGHTQKPPQYKNICMYSSRRRGSRCDGPQTKTFLRDSHENLKRISRKWFENL